VKRILLKTILIVLTFFTGGLIFAVMKNFELGALPLWIVAAGMFAGIRAIWRYNPASEEINLKKI